MITVIAHYTAAAGAADAVRELLARHAAASRAEPGCLQFDAHQGIDSARRVRARGTRRVASRSRGASADTALAAQRRDRTGRAAHHAKLDGVRASSIRASSVTPPTTCSPLA